MPWDGAVAVARHIRYAQVFMWCRSASGCIRIDKDSVRAVDNRLDAPTGSRKSVAETGATSTGAVGKREGLGMYFALGIIILCPTSLRLRLRLLFGL